jgi:undecaprenyl-diphosphatase
MTWFEALILGVVQGLAEFLPISSSGHLEIGKVILNIQNKEDLSFAVAVHGGTVLSTILVFRNDLAKLLLGVFKFQKNEEMSYFLKILASMLPVLIVGLFFKEQVESFFTGNMILVGSMLIITASLLFFAHFSPSKEKKIGYKESIIIGISQAIAVLPGISRSGATIATGLILGVKKEEIARFSFLMVLIPIIGANFLDITSMDSANTEFIGWMPILIGFFTAFAVGYLACSWMINVVKKGKLLYFALYCLLVGLATLTYVLF